MPTWRWRWRGLGAAVTVPDRIARARSQRAPLGNLRFKPAPRLNVERRNVRRALDFLIGDADVPAPVPPVDREAPLAEQVNSLAWYHTLELPGGVVTPGRFDHRALAPRYGFPPSLSGKRALDVATFDGFWAFEMERRGATVTAIDLGTTRDVDFPSLVRPLADATPNLPEMGAGFAIAKEALGSSVERRVCSVYDLNPEEHGVFDLVHCGDLLIHLRDPLKALEAMRSVTSGQMLLSDGIALRGAGDPGTAAMIYLGGWEDVLWWAPSLDALAQMTLDAGYRDVKVNCLYNLAKTDEHDGLWRASLTATV